MPHRRLSALLLALLAAPASSFAQDRSLAFLESLHLRPNQRAAYVAYMNATKPDPGADARQEAESHQLGAMTTPQRIDWTETQLRADLQTMEQQGAAVKRFYQQLSPEQRRTFDQQTAPTAR